LKKIFLLGASLLRANKRDARPPAPGGKPPRELLLTYISDVPENTLAIFEK
jgi:hypothetical protein